MVSEAPAHPSTKVPMLLEDLANLRHEGADGTRGSSMTKGLGPSSPMMSEAPTHPRHQGADATRGSRPSEAPRLPHIQEPRLPMVFKPPAHPRLPMASKALARPSNNVLMLPHHRRLRLPMVPNATARLRAQGEGPGRIVASFSIFRDSSQEHRRESSPEHCRNGSLKHYWEPNRWWGHRHQSMEWV
ncbi:hypothetical protein GOBAR_AA09774 [Gossypium barbadense]|uniref:Uncharacterized protein n=1 Tax=Gossypium barbadense TaxID=3634 RepID=A0A2P5Y5K6_GOSBA|nr:hypothetical protein GOBAR_AA09774 [Gossypium barbadense]